MYIKAIIKGDLKKAMQDRVATTAARIRTAVARTGRAVQDQLRAQARSAGFRDGGRALANSWRLRVYPARTSQPTFRPAALVYSKAPRLVDAFDRGATITTKSGKYLAIPTPANIIPGRGSKGRNVRVTPQQMMAASRRGDVFVLKSRHAAGRALWCLKVREGRSLSRRGRNTLRLFAGNVRVLTGSRKGAQAALRRVLDRGFLPMFFLQRSATLRKRLNTAEIRARGG